MANGATRTRAGIAAWGWMTGSGGVYGWSPRRNSFEDRLLGPQSQDPAEQCGDLLIRDRLGNWTYQFAVVVDDMEQGITDVIRGQDLLASTGRQIQLARLLGRDRPPRFAHHPLVMKSPTEKLSKSDGATGVANCERRVGRPRKSWTVPPLPERWASICQPSRRASERS